MAGPTSLVARRALFATRQLWVTPHHDAQRYPSGEHVVQSTRCLGLAEWTQKVGVGEWQGSNGRGLVVLVLRDAWSRWIVAVGGLRGKCSVGLAEWTQRVGRVQGPGSCTQVEAVRWCGGLLHLAGVKPFGPGKKQPEPVGG